MKLIKKAGATSEIWQLFIRDSSSTTGAGLTGLVFNSASLTAYYHRDVDTTATQINLVTMSIGTFTSSGFKEIDATNMPGWYQFCPPNTVLASGAKSCAVHLKGATNMAPLPIEVQLLGVDPDDSVRFGMTALPNAAAGASGGLIINGSNSGTVTLAALTVSGATTLAAFSCTTLTASGAVAFQSTFAVTTSTSLAALSCTTLTASGAVAFQSTFAVTTSTSLAALSCTTLTASGTTSLAAVTTSGTVTLNALTVSGATTLTGVVTGTNASNDLRINGAVPGAANGLLIAGSNAATTFATLTSTGAFTINGTSDVAQTGDSFARIGAAGAGLTAVVLASTGLDAISTTAPSGVASTFREMMVQTWRRYFKKATLTSTQLKTYADNGTTVLTTQTVSDDGTTQTEGAAS